MATGHNRSTRKLKPWLVEQIESGKYHGLVWDDELKTCFRIPWKHAGKQDFRHDEDAAIFKAWAQYKNKYKNGDKVDAATWKTRLRCALNKSPEFQEVPDRSQLDISEPYKVYRIVPLHEQETPSSEKTAQKRKSVGRSSTSDSDELRAEKKPHLNLELSVSGTLEVTNYASADSGNGSDSGGADMLYIDQHDINNEPPQPVLLPTNFPASPMYPSESLDTGMQITILYSGVEVSKLLVQSECKLSASAPRSSYGMQHVLLPAPGEQLDQDTCKKTKELLKFLEAGVMLASNTNGIFAQRQKKCSGRVFWIGPCGSSPGAISKLEREEHVKLFDTQKFLQDLKTYKTEGGVPPVCSVTLCFGEEISDRHPMEDKLITARIEQVMAYELVRKATESLNGAQDSVLEEPTFLTTLLPVDVSDNTYS